MTPQADYALFLDECGLTESFVRSCSEMEGDQSSYVFKSFYVDSSPIEGKGMFSRIGINEGEAIMPATIEGMRTIGGRYVNHHPNPNAKMRLIDGDVFLMATKEIGAGDEVTTSYRDNAQLLQGFNRDIGDDIAALESAMKEMDQVDLPIIHHFAHGVYGREMAVPAGVSFVGKIHKTEHLNILAKGIMIVTSATGGQTRLEAPAIFVSPPNTKRAGYAETDCVFINIHGTHETDLEKIESEFITEDYLSIGDER